MTDWLTWILIVTICVVLIFLLPSRYDPAIRLKEYNERKAAEALKALEGRNDRSRR